ncbi:hypothetical protein KUV85_06800 [Nocardioides panacisoli]|uniref:hypothetical protein n=1 Tax=Nocardioides panacisoli TaxID=627624 RepID=UPI001C638AED|nr:hypothetical protein [Nocardioides panacisoli]QYJ05382.1 hypothetical protein KUV85_06800 [Nocardioides panacisoli]
MPTTDSTTHYQLPSTSGGNAQLDALRAACAAFDIDHDISRVNHADLELSTMPTEAVAAAELADEAVLVSATEAATWVEHAAARLAQARDMDHLRAALLKHRDPAAHRRYRADRDDVLARLTEPVATAIEALTKDVKKLPASAPLDTEAVIATDASAAYKRVKATLSSLGTVAALLLPSSRAGLRAHVVLPFVDVPDLGAEPVNARGQSLEDENPDRAALHRLHRDAQLNRDLTLLAAARGDYGERITLSAAATRQEVADRVARLDRALTRSAQRSDQATTFRLTP